MTALILAGCVLLNAVNIIFLLNRVTRLERVIRLLVGYALPEDTQ